MAINFPNVAIPLSGFLALLGEVFPLRKKNLLHNCLALVIGIFAMGATIIQQVTYSNDFKLSAKFTQRTIKQYGIN